ncbi:hypothetical protein PPEP_a0890 [Pseudoalteromonas peptidolytica F12-50-A1]|uniref:Uncharacterized protein n=1 Tax=Pseudoalteromonas peptidolytica F12-50-A1 TaxID=1315280 RepID=A0A8I0MVB1_9GAMM|nr:hypothetical protein [Pseudoalteromonas peptidolytica F12-50-A1]
MIIYRPIGDFIAITFSVLLHDFQTHKKRLSQLVPSLLRQP